MDLISYQVAVMQVERAVARRVGEGRPVPVETPVETPRDRRGVVLAALRRRLGEGLVRAGQAMVGAGEPAYGVGAAGDPCRG